MKSLVFGFLALAVLPAVPAHAGRHDDCPSITLNHCCEPPTHWADRWEPGEARRSISTEDGTVTLLLSGDHLALQLSDHAMHKITRKLREEEDKDDDADVNPLAMAVKTAVFSSVRSMLDHSIECRLHDIRSAEYRNGRLIFVDRDGDRLFEGIKIEDRPVLESFSDEDARDFVAELERAKQRR